jgi:hypothetical protein
MCQVVGHKLEDTSNLENINIITKIKPLSPEELRLKRLAFYDKAKEIDV